MEQKIIYKELTPKKKSVKPWYDLGMKHVKYYVHFALSEIKLTIWSVQLLYD